MILDNIVINVFFAFAVFLSFLFQIDLLMNVTSPRPHGGSVRYVEQLEILTVIVAVGCSPDRSYHSIKCLIMDCYWRILLQSVLFLLSF